MYAPDKKFRNTEQANIFDLLKLNDTFTGQSHFILLKNDVPIIAFAGTIVEKIDEVKDFFKFEIEKYWDPSTDSLGLLKAMAKVSIEEYQSYYELYYSEVIDQDGVLYMSIVSGKEKFSEYLGANEHSISNMIDNVRVIVFDREVSND